MKAKMTALFENKMNHLYIYVYTKSKCYTTLLLYEIETLFYRILMSFYTML